MAFCNLDEDWPNGMRFLYQTSWVGFMALVIYTSQGDGRGQTIINTVVGNGRILTGLGGPAVSVPLAEPKALAFDSKGNLYIGNAAWRNFENHILLVIGTQSSRETELAAIPGMEVPPPQPLSRSLSESPSMPQITSTLRTTTTNVFERLTATA